MLLIITKGGIYTYRAFLKSTKLFLINKVIIYDGYIVPINTDQIIKEDCEPAKICNGCYVNIAEKTCVDSQEKIEIDKLYKKSKLV